MSEPRPDAAGAPFAVVPRGAFLLGIGQAVLVVGLTGFGLARSLLDGARWPIVLGAVALLVVFAAGLGLGLVHRPEPDPDAFAPRAWTGGQGVRIAWVLVLLVLASVLVVASSHFLWLLFPLWMVVAQVVSLPVALPAIAASLAVVVSIDGGRSSSAAVIGPVVGALVAVGLARGALRLQDEARRSRDLLARVVAAQAEAAALSDEVVRAQREAGVLAERTRLARDIHDTLAQGFSSILLLARAAGRAPDADPLPILSEIEATAAASLAEARRVVYALTPPDLAEAGLAAPLRRMGEELARQTGAEVTVEIDPDLPRLAPATEVALLRAAQGALANVRRHAHARRVGVGLAASEGVVRLDVVDDGVGFDPTRRRVPTLEGGYGLTALRDRLAELGGGLAVESEPGEGTAVSAHLPLTRGDA